MPTKLLTMMAFLSIDRPKRLLFGKPWVNLFPRVSMVFERRPVGSVCVGSALQSSHHGHTGANFNTAFTMSNSAPIIPRSARRVPAAGA
jgi:hypothetical protein